jgi:hypothetical protein
MEHLGPYPNPTRATLLLGPQPAARGRPYLPTRAGLYETGNFSGARGIPAPCEWGSTLVAGAAPRGVPRGHCCNARAHPCAARAPGHISVGRTMASLRGGRASSPGLFLGGSARRGRGPSRFYEYYSSRCWGIACAWGSLLQYCGHGTRRARDPPTPPSLLVRMLGLEPASHDLARHQTGSQRASRCRSGPSGPIPAGM